MNDRQPFAQDKKSGSVDSINKYIPPFVEDIKKERIKSLIDKLIEADRTKNAEDFEKTLNECIKEFLACLYTNEPCGSIDALQNYMGECLKQHSPVPEKTQLIPLFAYYFRELSQKTLLSNDCILRLYDYETIEEIVPKELRNEFDKAIASLQEKQKEKIRERIRKIYSDDIAEGFISLYEKCQKECFTEEDLRETLFPQAHNGTQEIYFSVEGKTCEDRIKTLQFVFSPLFNREPGNFNTLKLAFCCNIFNRLEFTQAFPELMPYTHWMKTIQKDRHSTFCIVPDDFVEWTEKLPCETYVWWNTLMAEWNGLPLDFEDPNHPSQIESIANLIQTDIFKQILPYDQISLLDNMDCNCNAIPFAKELFSKIKRLYQAYRVLERLPDTLSNLPDEAAESIDKIAYVEKHNYLFEGVDILADSGLPYSLEIGHKIIGSLLRRFEEWGRTYWDETEASTLSLHNQDSVLATLNYVYPGWFEQRMVNFREKNRLPEFDYEKGTKVYIKQILEMDKAEQEDNANKLKLKEAEARADERSQVLLVTSHIIKNYAASVSDPLTILQNELNGTQRKTVADALVGTNLILDVATGIHMSMRDKPGVWRRDVLEPGFGATTLDKIILNAMRSAISNMFNGKYFARFVRNYFGRNLDVFMQAQKEWEAAETAVQTFSCINKYFFDFALYTNCKNLNIPVGNSNNTETKFLLFFQELFLNAVKYSSFIERKRRFVELDITVTQEQWNIKLSNSATKPEDTESSGYGLVMIKDFANFFEAKFNVGFKDETYMTSIDLFMNKRG